MITPKEIRVNLVLLEKALEESISSNKQKNIAGLRGMIVKFNSMLNSSIGYDVTEEKERDIKTVLDHCKSLITRYSQLKDMSQVFEYDRLKKECGMILDTLGDLKAEFDTYKDFAKADLKALLYKIADEYQQEADRMSATTAEKKAEFDDRYTVAKEEYKLYLRYASIIKTKFDVMKDIHQAIIQSVSTGRVGMIKESYVDGGREVIGG